MPNHDRVRAIIQRQVATSGDEEAQHVWRCWVKARNSMLRDALTHPQRRTAIGCVQRAQAYLSDPAVPWQYDHASGTLTLTSPQSGQTYNTNGTDCTTIDHAPCPSNAEGGVCWHRAAQRLLQAVWRNLGGGTSALIVPIIVPPHPSTRSTSAAGATIPFQIDGTVVAQAGSRYEADQLLRQFEQTL